MYSFIEVFLSIYKIRNLFEIGALFFSVDSVTSSGVKCKMQTLCVRSKLSPYSSRGDFGEDRCQ